MRPKKKKLIVKLSVAVLCLFVVFVVYAMGLPHRAALAVAKTANIEWRVSPPQIVSIYYPRWACGPDYPAWLLVEADAAEAAPLAVGKPVWIFNDHNIDFGEYHFVECRGKFKSSLTLLIREHRNRRPNGDPPVTGRLFEAESCTPKEPSAEQSKKIDGWINPE